MPKRSLPIAITQVWRCGCVSTELRDVRGELVKLEVQTCPSCIAAPEDYPAADRMQLSWLDTPRES